MKPSDVLDWRRQVHELYREVRAESDCVVSHQLWRGRRDELFATHPVSPIRPENRPAFTGLDYAAYDPALRHTLTVDVDVQPRRWEFESGTDGIVPFELFGVLHVPDVGELGVWWLGSYGGGVFIPVKDGLAGRGTYGGGRYVVDTVKGADLGGDVRGGQLVIDLNFSYQPSCAYDPGWACPLAPPENTVSSELDVGERFARRRAA